MTTIQSMKDAEARLMQYERPAIEVAYSLDTMVRLMDYLGNPQNRLQVVHVAGTSGKTSTAYYCASLLYDAGYKVGLSVSPHIDTVAERTQVNMQLLPTDMYVTELEQFLSIVDGSGLTPSYFEVVVAFSYWLFNKQGIDVAVMEVGLGGLLDATNVVSRPDKVCVITDIGYDHMAILGDTLPKIARQKAGIITPGSAVFMHRQASEVEEVIHQTALAKKATVHVALNQTIDELPIFQQRNFSLAVSAVQFLSERDGRGLSKEAIDDAMHTIIPARMEAMGVGSKTVVVDGSHNEQKIDALVRSFLATYPNSRVTLVTAFGDHRGDSARRGLALLRKVTDTIVVTGFDDHQDMRHQSMKADALADLARDADFTTVYTVDSPTAALETALNTDSDVVLVTGSFYLLRYIRPALRHKK